MRRIVCLTILAALGAMMAALPAAASTQRFNAQFHDVSCGDNVQCGAGVVQGFGKMTTTIVITGVGPGPGGCLAVTAERSVTLIADGSTLDLEAEALLCNGQKQTARSPWPAGPGCSRARRGAASSSASGASSATLSTTSARSRFRSRRARSAPQVHAEARRGRPRLDPYEPRNGYSKRICRRGRRLRLRC